MIILRDLSLIWSMFHILVLFIFFYESRFSRKTTIILTLVFMGPLGLLNLVGLKYLGVDRMGQMLMLTCTVPSAVFFFFMSRQRNLKFLFTFCAVDTISYEVLVISRILDYYLGGDQYILMFVLRLLAFPAMELLAMRYLRRPYLQILRKVKKGWGVFTWVSVIYYALLLLVVHVPTLVVYRPEYMPGAVLLLALMPVTYIGIFLALRSQMQLLDAERREQILHIQSSLLEQRIQETTALESQMRIQRHDQRHRNLLMLEMLRAGRTQEALAYLDENTASLTEPDGEHYCTDPILDAVFTIFARKAREKKIPLELSLSMPKYFAFSTGELSVVLSNVLENAIHANLLLPEEMRMMKCRCVSSPQFMFQLSNPFSGQVLFDSDGLPVTEELGHGTGVRSIVAFCEKNEVYSEFKVEDGWFVFRMSST